MVRINKNLKRESPNEIMLNNLKEQIIDAIRQWPKEVKRNNGKELLECILSWTIVTNEEAVGILEIAKQRFILLQLTEEEKKKTKIMKNKNT